MSSDYSDCRISQIVGFEALQGRGATRSSQLPLPPFFGRHNVVRTMRVLHVPPPAVAPAALRRCAPLRRGSQRPSAVTERAPTNNRRLPQESRSGRRLDGRCGDSASARRWPWRAPSGVLFVNECPGGRGEWPPTEHFPTSGRRPRSGSVRDQFLGGGAASSGGGHSFPQGRTSWGRRCSTPSPRLSSSTRGSSRTRPCCQSRCSSQAC